MIGKVCRRGTDTRRLLGYLFTEGLAGERGLESAHVDARVIAGYQARGHAAADRVGPTAGRTCPRLAALLDAPVRAGGVGKDVKATYHLAISAAPTDRTLTDAEWADIAELYVDRLGLAERGDDSAVRWVAVRHADNHVHVVATLVRQDGRRVFPHHDFYRAREASLEVERRYGLDADQCCRPDRHAGDDPRRAAQAPAAPCGRPRTPGRPAPAGPDREVLRARVRAALAGSQDWEQFAGRLRLSGVLLRERYSTRNPGELTGYAVRLMPTGAQAQTQGRRRSGSVAASSLPTCPCRSCAPAGSLTTVPGRASQVTSPGPRFAGVRDGTGRGVAPCGDRRRSCRSSSGCGCGSAPRTLCAVPHADISDASSDPTDPAAQAAAQAAAASAAEVLGAVSWLVERKRGGPLHAAAEDYGRAARELHRRTVPATARSRSARSAAGALLSARLVKGPRPVSCSPCSPDSPPCPNPLPDCGTRRDAPPKPSPRDAPPNSSPASTSAGRKPRQQPCRAPCRLRRRVSRRASCSRRRTARRAALRAEAPQPPDDEGRRAARGSTGASRCLTSPGRPGHGLKFKWR